MFKLSSGRNHRSKGIKARHVLQICVLLAVCFWLIYQVKHSQDKKKEFDVDGVKPTPERSSSDNALKLGRKDIHSPGKETAYNDSKDGESDENIRDEDDDWNKLEEDEVEENKMKHKVDDGATASREKADGTNEHGREGSDAATDQEEEFIDDDDDEVKEKEGEDNVVQETDSGNENIPIEKENESNSDGADKSIPDAHEEPHSADDASTAVSQDPREKTSAENESARSKEESKGSDDAEGPNKGENGKEVDVEGSKDDKESSNIAPTSENNELKSDNSENGSPPNPSLTEKGNFTIYNSTEAVINDMPLLNSTENGNMLDHSLRNLDGATSNEVSISNTIASEPMDNSSLNGDNNGVDGSNSPSDSDSTSESAPEKTITSEEASAETHNRTMLSTKVRDEFEHERSDSDSNSTDESSEATYNKNLEVAAYESIDISDPSYASEETDVGTDFDTLPAIKGEGTYEDDSAAE